MFMENYKEYATLVLRVFLGIGFLVAGLDKVFHLPMAGEMFAGMFGGAGTLMLWLALLIEIVGGLFLLIGYQTRWAASVLAVLIVVAFVQTFGIGPMGGDFVGVLREIFVMNTGGSNAPVNVMYFAGLLALAFAGSEEMAVRPE